MRDGNDQIMDIEDAIRADSDRWRADLLLERMRPKVEEILQELQKEFPDAPHTGAPSQSLRAHSYVHIITRCMKEGDYSMWLAKMLRHRTRLEEFLAVHETVRILEYPDNHPWIFKD